MLYGYDDLMFDLSAEKDVFSIGKSYEGRDILAVIRGEGVPRALIHGGIHARESITSALAVRLLKKYSGNAVCFVPMVNPDGCELCKYGGAKYRLWKANARSVDLNVNFDADWGEGKLNIRTPHFENYIGGYPESEPETQALVALTKKYNFCASVSLHSKGEVIYYGYKDCKSYIEYAKMFSVANGYPLEKSGGSCGGYKDWFVLKGFGCGVTVEVGADGLSHPIGLEHLDKIYGQNKRLAAVSAAVGEEIWTKNL